MHHTKSKIYIYKPYVWQYSRDQTTRSSISISITSIYLFIDPVYDPYKTGHEQSTTPKTQYTSNLHRVFQPNYQSSNLLERDASNTISRPGNFIQAMDGKGMHNLMFQDSNKFLRTSAQHRDNSGRDIQDSYKGYHSQNIT